MSPDFPRPAVTVNYDAIASAVWSHSTRELTGFTGQARSDLVGADEPIYTRLDVEVSTRSSHTVEDIWNHATRTLTSLAGQPRIDLLGEDASFEEGTGYRKTMIDRLASIDAFDEPIEGEMVVDDNENNMVLDELSGNPLRYLEGYIDLSPMDSENTMVIRQYMKISEDGDYVKFAEETYSGPQSLPLLYVVTKPTKYGIKITAQMTAGTSTTIRYQFFRRRVA